MYHSTLLLLFLDYKRVAINITQSSTGVLSYLCTVQANLICRISAANWPLSVSTRAEICKLFWSAVICLFWWACVVGVGISENFSFYGFSRIFCLLVHFAVVLFVYKQAGTHHVMNTDTGWHRHAEETTKYATGVEFHKNTKADFIAMFRWRRRERCGCKWGDEVGMNDIPFTISLGGAHCGAGNREAGCKLFKLPVYRAFLPVTPPPHPCLTYWIAKFIEMLFST